MYIYNFASICNRYVFIIILLVYILFLKFVFKGFSLCVCVYEKLNTVGFRIKYVICLNCPPDTMLCLCDSFLSLFLLSNSSNPHASTLEHTNPLWLGLQQSHYKVWLMTYDNPTWHVL